MFFKKLELQGFKSFGHKTVLDFQPGFTIVVGPNGCGKSNVLDAIRWVLGETSAKALRGGRMGDVVFRGSSSTKPAGLASITLTLDNSAGSLRIDQQEVAVTRRLFASGESEYQLNKIGCRMRDIHELFLDTGLGADGYSIIEQGQIGQMVAAKPNERREIFEEAAGISRYKVRREETLRKLVRTRDDLARLNDLVGEVERQCNSLRHQARKAQRHRRLTRRLHRLQQRLIVLRHDGLAAEFATVSERLAAANAAFESAAAAAATAEAQTVKAQQELEERQGALQRLQQQRFERRTELDREKHRVAMLGQQIAQADERLAAIDKELESRQSRLTVMQGTLEALDRDLAEEDARLGEANAEYRARQERLEALRRETQAENEALSRLRGELNEWRSRQGALENDKRVAQTLLERLTDDATRAEEQLEDLRRAVDEAEQRHEEARKRSDQLNADLEANRAESEQLQARIGEDDRSKKELAERLDSLTGQLNQSTARLRALKELEDSYEGYFKGVREVMQAADRNHIRGVVGVVSSLLDVPSELEIAVEVCLGGDLQDIVMDHVEDAKQAIAYLKSRNLGRATFLPLDFLHTDYVTRHLEAIWGRPGILGLGRDLVRYDGRIKPAVEYLFGNTVFVEHLDIAVDLEREGIRNRFVSLQGDVVNPRGVLSGGSHQTRGLLSRQREIRQLALRVETLEGDLSRLQAEMRTTQDRLGQLYARSAELQANRHQLQMQQAGVSKDLQQAEKDRRESRNQFASVEARVAQQRVERQRQQEIITNSDAALVEIIARLESQGTQLAEREQRTRGMAEDLQSVAEQAAAARDNQTRLGERVTALRMRLQEMRDSLGQSEADSRLRREERERLLDDRRKAVLDREEAENALGDHAREFEELDNQANDTARENEEFAAAMRRSQGEAQRLQRDRNEADNNLREVQVQHAELRAQMEYLEREAEDEFGHGIEVVKIALAAEEEAERAAVDGAEGEEEEREGSEGAEEPATTAEDDQITDPAQLRSLVTELRGKLARMGAVNEAAIEEYATQSERLTFLTAQRDDLQSATEQLEDAIRNIDETTKNLFETALNAIRENFSGMFRRLFNGGKADLVMVQDEKFPEPGIDIYAQPPGKNIGGSITLMSGGEKALTAIALMFALFQYRPSPICILDEIDAPLDDVNVGRMCDALKEFARDTQFLVITHNKITMGLADTIYGVTMQEPGISKLVSVKFSEAEEAGLLADGEKIVG
jgi:chromosome segregation protein